MDVRPISAALSLLQPYLLKTAIDEHVSNGDSAGLLVTGALYGAAMIGEFGFLYLQYTLTMRVAQRALADLRLELFTHVLRLPARFFDRNPVGRLVTRLTTDVDVINEMFASGGLTILMDVATLVGIIVLLLVIDFRLALVTLSVIPVVALAVNFFRVRARESYRRIRERIARLNAYLQEALAGMAVIQLFAREAQSAAEFDHRNDAHRRANHKANLYEAALFSMVESVGSICFALIVWYGGFQILSGALAFGTLVAFIEYVQKFFVPIRDFSAKYAVMQSAMTAAERVFQLLDTEPTIQSPAQPRLPTGSRGRVELEKVSFAYRGEDWVLRDVSFRIEPGEKIAIVGATGSGKSTVIKLLNRTYDVGRGRVLVDGIDVRDWDLTELRRRIGIVLQDVFLFAGTVRENLSLGRAEVSEEKLHSALHAVQADRFLDRLAGGLEGTLRERGSNLSTGERQILSFARALAFDPAILVLDEATSNVDTETETLLQAGVAELLRDRTALVIAHRLSTIEHADRILVLHAGELREQGTHSELLRQRGLYHRLIRLQYGTSDGVGEPIGETALA